MVTCILIYLMKRIFQCASKTDCMYADPDSDVASYFGGTYLRIYLNIA